VLVLVLALLSVTVPAPAALGHGGDESEEGYVLVQQALAHLAHDTTHVGMELAMEKVDDALAAEDQEGVAVAEVERAMQALEANRAGRARSLLQRSIEGALSELPPAVGEQTGTTVVAPALERHGDLTGRDWWFLAMSTAVLLAGVLLAYRFRPSDTVGDLRKRLAPGPAAASGGAGQQQVGRP
jgi:hypothetical protein